jgi:3-deoxy-D-manno-octulosonic-acid transferase|tara:strand:+ start:82 stop:1347 length:1266 start_codon:yes stop_codon:yes gene_type:complete
MYFFIYKIVIFCLIPFALARLTYRALTKPIHLQYLNERFALYSKKRSSVWKSRKTVWFHCVSVGETKAIVNLIQILLKQHPSTYFLISHMTLTGRNTELINNPRIHRTYLPYDTKGASKRFLSFYQPKIGVIVETELWFNLIDQCKFNNIPLNLINARLSKKSLNKYLPFRKFINSKLLQLDSIYVRSEEDLSNFSRLTKANIKLMGNIKFDSSPPKGTLNKTNQLKKQLKISSHFVLVAGSTRAGEEKILLNLVKKLNYKDLILVIVPRHPERFSEVEKIFQSQSLKIVKKSDLGGVKKTPQYVLGDTMGELYELYGLATLAVIGGSILDYGGQNPIEPMSLNVQTAVGPSIYNFKDMVNTAEKNKAIFRFKNIAELEVIIKNLVDKGQVNQGVIKNAQKYIKQSSGGTDKVVQLINQYL